MKTFAGIFSTICVLLLSAADDTKRETVLLKNKYVKSDVIRYRMTTDATMNIAVAGQGDPKEIVMKISYVIRGDVEDVDAAGSTTIKVTYESLAMNIGNKEKRFEYDSTKDNGGDPKNDAAKGLTSFCRSLAGKSFSITLSSDGTLQKIAGINEIIEAICHASPIPGMSDFFRQNFSEEQIKKMYQECYPPFPTKPIKVGDKWKNSLESKIPMTGDSMTTDISSTLAAIEGLSYAVIRVKISHSIKHGDEAALIPGLPQGTKANVALEQSEQDGTYIFDLVKGRVTSGIFPSDMMTTMRFSVPNQKGGAPEEITMTVKTTGKTTLILLPKGE